MFVQRLVSKVKKSKQKITAFSPLTLLALLLPKTAVSESEITEPLPGEPNAATHNLLSLGFNQPKSDHEQTAIFIDHNKIQIAKIKRANQK